MVFQAYLPPRSHMQGLMQAFLAAVNGIPLICSRPYLPAGIAPFGLTYLQALPLADRILSFESVKIGIVGAQLDTSLQAHDARKLRYYSAPF